MEWIKHVLDSWKKYRENDPVRSCDVYKTVGCAHVDGMLCDMKTCEILKKHKEKRAFYGMD